jgi:SOS-response transcriptional repressor LexA
MEGEATVPVPTDWNGWVKSTIREISMIRTLGIVGDFAAKFSGDRLERHGIRDGDWLICAESKSYTPGSLAVWETPKGRVARFERVKGGKLVGVCIRVERDNPTISQEVQSHAATS